MIRALIVLVIVIVLVFTYTQFMKYININIAELSYLLYECYIGTVHQLACLILAEI